jgi:predicted transcriptional regulator
MATDKRSTTYRLSEEARGLLERLAERNGISQTAVLELAIRHYARHEAPGISATPDAGPADQPAAKKPRKRQEK